MIDLALPARLLNQRLQLVMDQVAHCLRAISAYKGPDLPCLPDGAYFVLSDNVESRVPGAGLPVQLGRPLPLDRLGPASRLWVLLQGTGDLITILGTFCLDASIAGNVVNLAAASPVVSQQAFREAVSMDSPGAVRFDKLGVPHRLAALRNHCGIAGDDELLGLESRLVSINTARNCLEHRGGFVTGQDENVPDPPGGLRVEWVAPSITAIDTDGKNERPLRLYERIDGMMRVNLLSPRERTFPRGTCLDFSAEEFVGCCWTVGKYGEAVVKRLCERARREAPRAFADAVA